MWFAHLYFENLCSMNFHYTLHTFILYEFKEWEISSYKKNFMNYSKAHLWPLLNTPDTFTKFIVAFLFGRRLLIFVAFVSDSVIAENTFNITFLQCCMPCKTFRFLTSTPFTWRPSRTLNVATFFNGIWLF